MKAGFTLGAVVTRQEIEQKMDELAREYHDTHDPEIPEEIFELARRLGEMEHSIDTDSDLEQRIEPGAWVCARKTDDLYCRYDRLARGHHGGWWKPGSRFAHDRIRPLGLFQS